MSLDQIRAAKRQLVEKFPLGEGITSIGIGKQGDNLVIVVSGTTEAISVMPELIDGIPVVVRERPSGKPQ